ncbi:hypothetical protein QU577_26850 [Priestia megaterium]|uniref:hypothetical protein n=1 Tax=Priestia megaterium TaxID=1404 RepID=UPI0025B26437|nr:hypothetical protein [Priestia megaterium]MDN3365385.1 hypothetical protein [Priestia megaterium]
MGTLRDQMKKWTEANGYQKPAKSKKKKRNNNPKLPVAPKERLTERDLRELMGTNRVTYERRRGSIRQK